MNKIRRKQIQEIIDGLEKTQALIDDLKSEEEEYRDNMPENLQESEKYYKADEACENLEEATELLNDVVANLQSAVE